MTRTEHTTPGELLLHPLVLASVGLLLLNDHVLKEAWPVWSTGKISDFAGLFFFPLMLQALVEWSGSLRGRWHGPSRRTLIIAAVATAIVFTALQLSPQVGVAYQWGLAALQWPVRAVFRGATTLAPVHLVQDPSDLVALPILVASLALGWRRTQQERAVWAEA